MDIQKNLFSASKVITAILEKLQEGYTPGTISTYSVPRDYAIASLKKVKQQLLDVLLLYPPGDAPRGIDVSDEVEKTAQILRDKRPERGNTMADIQAVSERIGGDLLQVKDLHAALCNSGAPSARFAAVTVLQAIDHFAEGTRLMGLLGSLASEEDPEDNAGPSPR